MIRPALLIAAGTVALAGCATTTTGTATTPPLPRAVVRTVTVTRAAPPRAQPARAPAPAPCLRSDGPGLRPYEHCGAGPAASGATPAVAQSSPVCRLLYSQWQAGSQDALVQYGQDGCDQSPAPIPGSCASGEVDVPVLGGCVSQATADANCSTGRYSESAGGCATPGDTRTP